MKTARTIFSTLFILLFPTLFASCNGMFKHDTDSNCLNPAASCFVPDVTAPQITDVKVYKTDSGTALDVGSTINTLYSIEVTYSEVMRDAENTGNLSFTGGTGDAELSISSAEAITDYTYRYYVTGQVRNGPISLQIDAVDVSQKALRTNSFYPLDLTGAVDLSVELIDVNSGFITTNTSGGEVNELVVQWQHDYSEDETNANDYWVMLNTPCDFGGTQTTNLTETTHGTNFSGSTLAALTPQTTTLLASTPALIAGPNELYICARNDLKNKEGYAIVDVNLDDDLPTSHLAVSAPASGVYNTPQTVDLVCEDAGCDYVVYTTDGSTPTISAGVVTNGIILTDSWVTPYTTDPTTTTFTYMAVDYAGNQQGTVESETYTIDSRVPNVTLSSVSSYYVTENTATGDEVNTSTISFKSSLSGYYQVLTDGSSCPASGGASWSSTHLNANTSTDIDLTAGSGDITGEGWKEVRICVQEESTMLNWVASRSLNIYVDNTTPTFTGISSATPDGTSMTLTWTAAEDDSPIYYDIYNSQIEANVFSGSAAATTETASVASNCTVNDVSRKITCTLSGYDPNQVYYFGVRARDAAGNAEFNTDTMKSGYVINITLTSAIVDDGSITTDDVNLTLTKNPDDTPETVTQQFSGSANDTINFTLVMHTDDEYTISITQPTGNVCALAEKQFGTVNEADVDMNLNCVSGYATSQAVNDAPAAPLNFRMYQGKNDPAEVASTINNRGIVSIKGTLYTLHAGDSSDYATYPSKLMKVEADYSSTSLQTFSSDIHSPVSDGSNIYFSDSDNDLIYKYNIASDTITASFPVNDTALCGAPNGVAIKPDTSLLYITCLTQDSIVKLNLTTGNISTVSTDSALNDPTDLVFIQDNLYIANYAAHTVLEIDSSTGAVLQTIGSGTSGFLDASFSSSQFTRPSAITTDGVSNLFVTTLDGTGTGLGNRLRKIDLKNKTVSTISGNTSYVYSSGTGIEVSLGLPRGIATDGRSLYVGDASYLRKITDNGLVGYWPLAGNENDYASDVTTNYNGTAQSGVTFNHASSTDRYDNADSATYFDGSSDGYVSVPGNNLPTTNSPRTLCAWFNPTSLPTDFEGIAAYGTTGSGNSFGLTILGDGTTTTLKLHLNSIDLDAIGAPIVAGKWAHACGSYDGTTAKLYLNGKLLAKEAKNLSTGSDNLQIGRYVNGDMEFTGNIADVRVYARALNEGEINELAQDADPDQVGDSYSSGATGLLSHWSFENSSDGGDAIDRGSLDYNLTGCNWNGSSCDTGTQTATTGKEGDDSGAYQFDSALKQYLYSDDVTTEGIGSGQDMSISAWVKLDRLPVSNENMAILTRNSASAGGFFFSYRESAGYKFYWTPSVGDGDFQPSFTLPIKTWSHIAVVQDGSASYIYVNGKELGNGTTHVFEPDTGSTPITIGAKDAGVNPFDGAIDDVRIYNNALTSDQVRQLAQQIPAGLVAAYDFTENDSGDSLKDVTGWGNELENAGTANLVANGGRFGTGDFAFSFNGTSTSYLSALGTASLPTGNSERTMCAWYRTTSHPTSNGVYTIVFQGDRTEDNCHILFMRDLAGTTELGSGFLDSDAYLTPYTQYSAGSWQFVCGVHSSSENKFYLNGVPVSSNTSNTLTISSSNLQIGADPIGNYFNGSIDDVMIWNRALEPEEIQALVRQANKKIVVTSDTFFGNMMRSDGDTSGGTGITGADFWCDKEFGSNYKAMIVDDSARVACTTITCDDDGAGGGGITESTDWVLQPFITYVRSDGVTPIFTANVNGIWDFGTVVYGSGDTEFEWTNSVSSNGETWTGLSYDWTSSAFLCYDTAAWNTNSNSIGGASGYGNHTKYWAIVDDDDNQCSESRHFYCVEQ